MCKVKKENKANATKNGAKGDNDYDDKYKPHLYFI